MKLHIILLAGILLLSPIMAFPQEKSKKQKVKKIETKKIEKSTEKIMVLKNEIDSVSYSLGVNIGNNLMQQGFDSINIEALTKALKDIYSNQELSISQTDANQLLTEYFQNIQKNKVEKNLKEGQKFLDENKKKPGVVTLPSGLQYIVIKEGTGPKPKATDMVTTHYHGTLINGKVFDSSVERGQPAQFPVNGVIKGWVEALQLMNVGSKWKLFVPANLAYGERGAGEMIGPNTTLIFEVELISIDQ
jgi:FKBP-type peptidyl-prolyl cis-trans isomerase FklB